MHVYVNKIKRPPLSKMIWGTANHSAQEFAIREQLAGKTRPNVKQQQEVFIDKLDTEIKEGITMDPGDNRNQLQMDGIRAIEDYDRVGRTLEPVATELPFELSFKTVDWKIVGRIDLVTIGDVIDWKFGKRAKTGEEPEVQTQLTIYNYARKIEHKDDMNKNMKIHFVRRGAVRNGVKEIDVVPSLSESRIISNVAETARAIIVAEKSGDFPAVYQDRVCSWCQYRDMCGLHCK